MPALRFTHNYSNQILTENDYGRYGVRACLKDGEFTYLPWRGFIERELAKKIPKARALKLEVIEYRLGEGYQDDEWFKIPPDHAVQGCLINGVVFGVLEKGRPRIVPRSPLSTSDEKN